MATNQSVVEFRALMKSLPENIKGSTREEVFRQAVLLAVKMKSAVHAESGTLRDSIRVEESKRDPLQALVLAGGPTTTHGNYDYALAVEFGTVHNPAQPFFWPTYRANKVAIRSAIRKKAFASMVTAFR